MKCAYKLLLERMCSSSGLPDRKDLSPKLSSKEKYFIQKNIVLETLLN